MGLPLRQQLDGLACCVTKHDTQLKSLQIRTKAGSLAEWDPMECAENSEPMLAVLLGADGGTQHAVAIQKDIVFDGNLPNALQLSKQALD